MLNYLFLFLAVIIVGVNMLAGKPVPLSLLFWLLLFWLFSLFFLQKKQKDIDPLEQAKSLDEQDLIIGLHKEAFVYDNFDALQNLAKEYGGSSVYWEQNPELAKLVAQGVKKLAERVETGNAPRKPKLEDFYYMGLMYEQGFGCEADLEKARSYFEKALKTTNCWSGIEEDNESLRAQVSKKIRDINSFFLQRQLHDNEH